MTSLDALYQALPITSAWVQNGGQAGCGGMAWAQIDLERADAYVFVAAVRAPDPERGVEQEDIDFCVTNVRHGVEAELTELYGRLPAVRVVLTKVWAYPVDANELMNRLVGRNVVRQALNSAGLTGVPEGNYRLRSPVAP